MRVTENEDGKSVVLTEKQMGHTLADFYGCVAKEAGHEETEETMYDCTKILVAPDVQDAIIRAYQKKMARCTDGCHYYKTCNKWSESA